MTLQSIAGYDAHNADYYSGIWGPGVTDSEIIPPVPATVPNYMSALDLNFVRGKRIGWNGSNDQINEAKAALEAAGAILVERPNINPGSLPGGVLAYEAKRDIGSYYRHLGPDAPIKTVEQEMADNLANEHEALKFGNGTHASAFAIDISPLSAASIAYRNDVLVGKQLAHSGIDRMMNNDTPADPTDDFIAILGSVSNGARAGYPQLTIPMGYNTTQRRTLNVSIHANAYKERDLLGVGVRDRAGDEEAPAGVGAEPEHVPLRGDAAGAAVSPTRGACNPDYRSPRLALAGGKTILPFSLETESVKSLQDRLTAGTLSSETLIEGAT